MDRFGVLVFHDQLLEDEQQISFSRQLGMLDFARVCVEVPFDFFKEQL